jgi:transposase
MTIVGGFDVHRQQITFDYIDTDSGEVRRGKITPATRERLRSWLNDLPSSSAAFALEGCTGWRFVSEELRAVGMDAHVAEPADTAALRGPKKRAKTDQLDARHLRELLQAASIPESWIPPVHVLEARCRVRLYKTLVDQRTSWRQRIQAQLFHHGVPVIAGLLTVEGRTRLATADVSPAAREVLDVALCMIDAINAQLQPLHAEIVGFARHQPGCRALMAHYGIGSLTAVAIWAELGDCRRFSSSADAVRHTGLDITVHSSDSKRGRGHLARQGPPVLRWALFEAAKCAARPHAPDHPYYQTTRDRLGATRATLSVARKLVRRCHHTLRALGDDAWTAPA